MRKTSVWVLCGLMGLATAAVAAAQTGSTGAMGTESGSMGSMSGSSSTTHKSTKHHSTAAKSSSMTGEVTEAADGGNFTLKNKKAEKQFNCSDSTKMAKGKTCKDIAKDQNLTAWYDSKLTVVPTPATRIRWNKAKAPAAAAAAAPAAATTPK
jgi:hypothetical protein